ncbi:FAD/NAD(P)-binding domain-containing protein [Lentinus tigrinus ALCF2SS1-6]|uniref:FAD/NAD(P)-binding domain-containing protein n=1 Tax=Lentinus tigrinus ALCF2SS1-6 TaxID=1328759 RepID=A0A5C2SMV6_9APHY|nr:FAD/NAD(P)-binding domain-containing protein [Lentinus tigrinus ALCF2SS1-6]
MVYPCPKKDFQVAVVGGGVCGLTCAIALHRAGVPVQLFEAAAKFGEIGAGIGVGPNAVQTLDKLGLLDAILRKVNPAELKDRYFSFYEGLSDSHEAIYRYPTLPEDKALGIHRAAFLDALVDVFDPSIAHFNKRCMSITGSQTDPKRLVIHFQDGTTHEVDVVLGADGVKSSVRDFVLEGKDRRLAFSHTVAYRGLIPWTQLQEAGFKIDASEQPVCIMGPSKHFILFPIKDGAIINVVAFAARYDIPIGVGEVNEKVQWVEAVNKDVLFKEYEGWGPDVEALLKCMPDKPGKWSIHVVHPPLESYVKGRIALLGDAAHAMLPHMGAGAGQGIEDAYMLSRLLGHPETNTQNIEAILEAYSRVRQPRAQMVWEGSRYVGRVYDLHGPSGPTSEGLRKDIGEVWGPVWHHNIEADLERAVASLRDNGTFATSH